MRALRPAVLLFLAEAGCAGGGPPREAGPEDEAAALEAVFRYQFDHNASSIRTAASLYCLCLPAAGREGGDPANDLLAHFAGNRPPAAACSACALSAGRIVERASGKSALSFYVAQVRWLPNGEAEVEGGYREGTASASRNRFRVVRRGAGWAVADVRSQRAP